ncbi:Peroxisomal membrane protein pex16 [Tulasnella sp. JGI-2019a]|nr:Peroxisomal membrane protein pex16 [Tulasnella sp. JGI-2019a]KAG9009227.1 Peroxisomal membrane protein pex16 [Tulasnella sp. JGI-2019a]KAG9038139.1 Peroxisomal membrane protein pex16 [Tulasnella sp. JGI-2019a]
MTSSAIARYESLLISNANTINTIESSIRSLTWFLPGRFKDAELASEALSAGLSLISLYHDTLLFRRVKSDPTIAAAAIPPSVHSRYTRAWADKDAMYKWAARMLEIIKFVQILVEMSMRRWAKASTKTVWRGIMSIELCKAFLRLTLLRITKRPTLSPPIPEREIDPATLSDIKLPEPVVSSKLPSPPSTPVHLRNNHVSLPTPQNSRHTSPLLAAATVKNPSKSQQQMIDEYLLPKALTTMDIKSPTSLLKPLAGTREWISEVIYLLRPLIYVMLLQRAARRSNPSSSTPLIVSLTLDLLSHHLRRTPPASSALERQEYAKRDRDLLWYFLRGGVWTEFTKPKLQTLVDVTGRVPLVNLAGALLQDWMPLIDEYYYYAAT